MKRKKKTSFWLWESLPTGKMKKAGGVRELTEFRVVGGYSKGLVWMLLASRGNDSTNCSAVRGRIFFLMGEMKDVMSKFILFLDHCRAVP